MEEDSSESEEDQQRWEKITEMKKKLSGALEEFKEEKKT